MRSHFIHSSIHRFILDTFRAATSCGDGGRLDEIKAGKRSGCIVVCDEEALLKAARFLIKLFPPTSC